MEQEQLAQFATWVQAGGVVAFAAAVWFELRAQRRTVEKLAAMVYALLERDRMRHGDTGPHARLSPMPSLEDFGPKA